MSLTDFIYSYGGCPIGDVGCWGPRWQAYLLGLPLNDWPSLLITVLIIFALFFIILSLVNLKIKKFNYKKMTKISIIGFVIILIIVYVLKVISQSLIHY